jgi:hypothetical protein
LLLAAHSWNHQPLWRLSDLVDIAVLVGDAESASAAELARDWGWEAFWRVNSGVANAVLRDSADAPAAVRLCARHMFSVRERSVFENHVARFVAPVCAAPRRRVPAAIAGAIRSTVGPDRGEPWAAKAHRSRLAVAHAFMPTSAHDRSIPRRH